MKKIYALFIAILFLGLGSASSQCTDCYAGGHLFPHPPMTPQQVAGVINGSLTQSLLLQNVCGLNYTQATVLTETRTAAQGFNFGGTGFPTTLTITGLPNLFCSSVLKAYLYYGCTYLESSPPSTSATVTNPSMATSTLPATLVGSTLDDICWPGPGSATYRVDVTSLISGNGNYKIDLNGFAIASNEVDGCTLIIVYSDASASYSGSIALYDGDVSNDVGISESSTERNFTVCSATSTATAFTLLADVQQNVSGGINFENYNGTQVVFPNNFWNYCNIPVSLTAGQDSIIYKTYENNSTDCYFIAAEGLYWQNTTCTTCIPATTTMTLTTATAPNTCLNNGSASVSVAGAAGPLTYLWGPGGQTTDTAVGLAPGSYTVSVSDGQTCATDSATVVNLAMGITYTTTPQYCLTMGNATATPTSGFPPYTYLWTPGGQTTATATGLISGTYSVTVSDNSGCSMTNTLAVPYVNDVSLNYATVIPEYSCPPVLGSATVVLNSGKSPFTYLWTPGGQTTASATGLTAGSYSFTVTDAYGCVDTYSTTIAHDSNSLGISIAVANIPCGQYEYASPSGGTPPYTYLWAPGGSTNSTAMNLSVGTYTVTVTDQNGCTITASAAVTYSNPVTINTSVTPVYTCPPIQGTATANVVAGRPPLTYSWSSGQTTSSISGLSIGTYTVTVSDSGGCAANATAVIILDSNSISLSLTGTGYYCPADEGTANANPSGGIPPYTYIWAPGGQTTQSISGLTSGTYSVTVEDSLGCMQSGNISINSVPVTFYTTESADTIIPGNPDTLSAYCNIPATYVWSTGATSSDVTVTPAVATTYTCVATTACGTYTSTVTMAVTCIYNSFAETICIATVDTATGKAEVIWERLNSPPSGSYNVYRDTGLGFSLADNQPLTALSEYIDPLANPNTRPISYELSTVDSCGESVLSAAHITIYLTTASAFNVNILNWTAYVGFTPSEYRIFRGPALNAMVQIDSVANTVLTFRDTLPPNSSVYLVEAVNPSGTCIPTTSIRRHTFTAANLSGSFSNGFFTENTITGVQSAGNTVSGLNIYPNPGNGMLNVNYSMNGNGNIRISIIDELGQVVYDNSETRNAGNYKEQLNLENLASGIYSLRMQTNNSITVKKLVVMKRN